MKSSLTRPVPWLAVVLAAALLWVPAAGAGEDNAELLAKADATLKRFMADPDLDWFRDKLPDARGLLIVPEHVKAGFIIGGSGGGGVLVAKNEETGRWTGPVFYRMGAASVGLQIGGQVAEIVLLVMTDKGMDALLSTKLQLGAGASVAAGPVGTGAEAATADVYTFARSKGLFAGVSLEGAVIKTNEDRNRSFYGQAVSPTDVLVRGSVRPPRVPELVYTVAEAAE